MQAEELRKLSEALIQFYEKLSAWEIAVARNSGLSTQQNHTIAIVGSAGRIRMKPLAEKLGVTTGTLTVMIDRLQKASYVKRQSDPTDGRAFNVILTEKGESAYKEHHTFHENLTCDIVGCLDSAEQERFTDILRKINTAVF
ncbi:MAG: MarR family transcriptional regulator [Deltaproteobacteria bacterium]|jgi:DNA-binding MarR family transcriptional regulator|nr:MarR family transcriptional regulator [Deltaproteobacteria bacterium]MBT4266497.1 MarR family transcriptional regulator [Deltaproteobacteria bacterium]MBT4637506.1 MarR family transcriptional regulator [Deltaproteobacteria bacterium]MBT6500108.1 MarR family transcriptional regulator [Deltaproteobacteria bacterium]MBT6613604.1 MarR family transcriptional regulator [Deltaproteobacteria bacterium]